MSNSTSENLTNTPITSEGLENANTRYAMWASNYKNATLHKSLDFSNVGLYASNTREEEDFRKFHQMTLYISFDNGGAISHGATHKTFMITSNLPEKLSYSLSSEWAQPLNFGSATTNLLMEMGTSMTGSHHSGVSRASTLKVWNGTKPLSLSLTIPVIDDVDNGGVSENGINANLVEALEILGSLVLPKRYNSSFYTSPPSPLGFTIKYAKGIDDKTGEIDRGGSYTLSSNQYCRIMLQLGGILLVDKCIIEGVDVTYPNTKTMIKHTYQNEFFGKTGNSYLHPLLAEVTLRISTVEALTAENYSKMLWARSQNNMGHGTIDASQGIVGYTTATLFEGYNKVKEFLGS